MPRPWIASLAEQVKYQKSLDPLNARIILECCRQGPRNLSSVSRAIGVGVEKVGYRFKRMRETGFLSFTVLPRYSRLGLVRCSVFADAVTGGFEMLEKALSSIPYWTYLSRSYGIKEGLYGVYVLPFANRIDFQDYLNQAKKLGVLEDFQLYFTSDAYTGIPDFHFFNFKKHQWIFPWVEWINKSKSASVEKIHPVLLDPRDYNHRLDVTDLSIIGCLELDSAQGFGSIGAEIDRTSSDVKYHWDNHILKQGMIVGYRPNSTWWPIKLTDYFALRLRCKDVDHLSRLVYFLSDKWFVGSYAKVLRENELVVNITIPKSEFEGLMGCFYKLRNAGVIQDFLYSKLDVNEFSAETIRPPNFTGGNWKYDLDADLERLHSIAVGSPSDLPRPALSKRA